MKRSRPERVFRVFQDPEKELCDVIEMESGYDRIDVHVPKPLTSVAKRGDDALVGSEDCMSYYTISYFPAAPSFKHGYTQYECENKRLVRAAWEKKLDEEMCAEDIFDDFDVVDDESPVDNSRDEQYLGDIQSQFEWQ